MSKVYLSRDESMVLFECPGCGSGHFVFVKEPPKDSENYSLFERNIRNGRKPLWTWNGDVDAPTFQPSVLMSPDYDRYRCHSFVEKGQIRFLMDCHHQLRGQTVELPNV